MEIVAGSSGNGDGIGDAPYSIIEAKSGYVYATGYNPLMVLSEHFSLKGNGPALASAPAGDDWPRWQKDETNSGWTSTTSSPCTSTWTGPGTM